MKEFSKSKIISIVFFFRDCYIKDFLLLSKQLVYKRILVKGRAFKTAQSLKEVKIWIKLYIFYRASPSRKATQGKEKLKNWLRFIEKDPKEK